MWPCLSSSIRSARYIRRPSRVHACDPYVIRANGTIIGPELSDLFVTVPPRPPFESYFPSDSSTRPLCRTLCTAVQSYSDMTYFTLAAYCRHTTYYVPPFRCFPNWYKRGTYIWRWVSLYAANYMTSLTMTTNATCWLNHYTTPVRFHITWEIPVYSFGLHCSYRYLCRGILPSCVALDNKSWFKLGELSPTFLFPFMTSENVSHVTTTSS